jgi:hypothetical protein
MSLWMAAFTRITVPKIPWGAAARDRHHGCDVWAPSCSRWSSSPRRSGQPRRDPGRPGAQPAAGRSRHAHPPAVPARRPRLHRRSRSRWAPRRCWPAMDNAWIRHARGWALASFLVSRVGNILGGWWAYTVLGWGGYWAWDPVENSDPPAAADDAVPPPLLVQERRGMLKAGTSCWCSPRSRWPSSAPSTSARASSPPSTRSRSPRSARTSSCSSRWSSSPRVVLMTWRLPRMQSEYDYESLAVARDRAHAEHLRAGRHRASSSSEGRSSRSSPSCSERARDRGAAVLQRRGRAAAHRDALR